MKYILSLIISGALVVSGFGQTRNVLVGTNNAVVQPTNFWSADASNARAGLGLGTASTNPATAFQPSSLALSNLAVNNGGGLTNLNATNIVGTLSVAQGGTGSTNASDARTALGLGTAATNPATAFQASSATLSNLATSNGGSLTNLQATSLVGVIPSSNIATVNFSNLAGTLGIASGGTGATNAANARQNLGSTTVGDAVFIATNAAAARTAIGALASNSDGSGLTNLTAANITGTVALASNLSSPLALTNGGTGTTNAATARTNLGLGWSALTNTDATNFRNAIGLGTTNIVEFGQIYSDDFGISNNAIYFGGQLKYEPETQTFQGDVFLNNGSLTIVGTNAATKIAATRTNLGLPWSGLTNTNAATFQAALFGANTNPVLVDTNGEVVSPTNFWQAAPITTTFIESEPNTNSSTNIAAARFLHIHSLATNIVNVTNTIVLPTNGSTFVGDVALVVHQGPTNSMTRVRTAGSTNDLVTMTRFDEAVEFVYYDNVWQFNHNNSFIEPIYFSGTNAAANAAASRTNLGLGATNNVTFAQGTFNGAVTFNEDIYGNYLEISDGTNTIEFQSGGFVFSGVAAAATRTNLGLGATWLTNTNVTNFRTAIGLGATNAVSFGGLTLTDGGVSLGNISTNSVLITIGNSGFAIEGETAGQPLFEFVGTNNLSQQARNDFGLGVTNNVAFRDITSDGDIVISNQSATNNGILFVYRTNNEPFLGLANLIASNNTTVSNETLFRVGVAEATNKAAQFGFRSTNTNGDGVAVFSTFGYNALMMVGPSDRSRTNYATNTNAGVEADIWSISPTNRVATLIDTNTGAFSLHRAIQFQTNDSSVGNTNLVPATNNQIQKWLRVYIGTNAYFLPLYQ